MFLEYFDTVQSIKEEINLDKDMKVPQSQQQLFLDEKLLEDNLTLSECGIQDGSQLTVRGMETITSLCTVWHEEFKACQFQALIAMCLKYFVKNVLS